MRGSRKEGPREGDLGEKGYQGSVDSAYAGHGNRSVPWAADAGDFRPGKNLCDFFLRNGGDDWGSPGSELAYHIWGARRRCIQGRSEGRGVIHELEVSRPRIAGTF